MDDFWAGCMVLGASIGIACFVLAGAEFIANLFGFDPFNEDPELGGHDD